MRSNAGALEREGRWVHHADRHTIFNEIVLADEINRAPPKVQSALLEAMGEKQVTAGGTTRQLPDLFIVMATQNPLEQSGTYPLPEAQLDRFMLHVELSYPTEDEELEILKRDRKQHFGEDKEKFVAFLTPAMVLEARHKVSEIYVSPEVEKYMVALVSATLSLLHAASAKAWLAERDFVTPDDAIDLLPDILRHRIALSFSGRAAKWTEDAVIQKIIELVEVPIGE